MPKWMKWSEYESLCDATGRPRSRSQHAACLCGGVAYINGGKDGNFALSDTWSYDTDTGNWRQIALSGDRLPSLQDHSMVFHKNSIYIFGGSFSDGFDANVPLWRVDIGTAECSKMYCSNVDVKSSNKAAFPISRRGHSAVVYGDSMFVYGGYIDMKGSSSELWEFKFGDCSWHLVSHSPNGSSSRPIARHSHSAVVFRHRLWIYGGLCNLTQLDDLWTWHIDEHKWSRIHCRVRPPALGAHTASVIGSSMYIIGGFQGSSPQKRVWIFDFDFLTWTLAFSEGIPCGPLTRHCCVVTVQSFCERRSASDLGSGFSAAIMRADHQRVTLPTTKAHGNSMSSHSVDAARESDRDFSIANSTGSNSIERPKNGFGSPVPGSQVGENEPLDCIGNEIFFASTKCLVETSSKTCLTAGIENSIFSMKDEQEMETVFDGDEGPWDSAYTQAVDKLGRRVDWDSEASQSELTKELPLSVELQMYGFNSDFDHKLRLEDLENELSVDNAVNKFFVDPRRSIHARKVWRKPVKEAWGVPATSLEAESRLQNENNENVQVRPSKSRSAKCSYSLYVFGGCGPRANCDMKRMHQ